MIDDINLNSASDKGFDLVHSKKPCCFAQVFQIHGLLSLSRYML